MFKGALLLLYCGIFSIVWEYIYLYFKRKIAKKCNYDCSKCSVVDCMSKECRKNRGV